MISQTLSATALCLVAAWFAGLLQGDIASPVLCLRLCHVQVSTPPNNGHLPRQVGPYITGKWMHVAPHAGRSPGRVLNPSEAKGHSAATVSDSAVI